MDVNKVQYGKLDDTVAAALHINKNSGAADTNKKSEADKTGLDAGAAAVYEKSNDLGINAFNAADPDKVRSILSETHRQTEAFRQMVEKLLQKQSKTAVQAKDGDMYDILRGQLGENVMVEIDEATRTAAQEAISEDGYYGVEKTAGRILDFAIAVAGTDPKKLVEMKSAFLKGFKQAEEMWGDKLPEISQKTYDAVLQGFADHAAKINGGEPPASL